MTLSLSKFTLPLAIMLCMTGCSDNETEDLQNAENEAAEQAALDGKIECALAGSVTFERTCTTEQIAGSDGNILVIRHADGGFRRFDILTDGRGLAPADGFDETRINLLSDGMIEVSSGDDKYRLPAQIKGKEQAEPVQDGKVTG